MPDASAPRNADGRGSAEAPAEPIPIPEVEPRSGKARTVKIQDILASHARALDVRLEEGMREIRLAMDSAIRRASIHEAPSIPQAQPAPQYVAPPPSPAPAPQTPAATAQVREDVAVGLAAQTEERFQALAFRLQKIEDALNSVALGGGASPELKEKLEALTDGMSRFEDAEEHLLERFVEAQRHGLEDLTHRVGAGVAAVIRALQNELTATVTRLELSADLTGAVAADDASRLERTMMAIAEHQESVLDERLAEIKESIGSPAVAENETAEPEPPS